MLRRDFLAKTGIAASGLAGLFSHRSAHGASRESGSVSFAHNESPLGADMDVLDHDEKPLFRVLLPESIWAENVAMETFLSHVTPGSWGNDDGVHWGIIQNAEWVEIRMALVPQDRGALVLFCVKNLSGQVLEDVQIDVCVSVSHLPSPTGNWINPDFLDVPAPYDRDEAGLYWYERVAPTRLKTLIDGEWVAAHPTPQSPSAKGVPKYKPFRYLKTPASVMATESLDKTKLLFQAWDKPCDVRYAFPGNSCMHLGPHIAEKLAPRETSHLRGQIATMDVDWDAVARWTPEQHREQYGHMKTVLERVQTTGSEEK